MATTIDQQTGLPQGFILDAPPDIDPEPANVGLPEGFVLDAPPVPEKGFLGRIGEQLGERAETFKEITAEPPESNLQSLGKGFQVLGNVVAGGVLDVVGETVSTGFTALSDVASAITPDSIEDPIKDKVKEIFTSAVGTDVAQAGIRAASQGIEAYQEWAGENPEAHKNISAAANIALAAIPLKGKPKVGKPAIKKAATLSDEFASIGVTPTLGMTGRGGAVIEGALESTPLTAGRIARERARVTGELSDATKKIAKSIGVASNNVDAGHAIQRGARQFVEETGSKGGKLFDKVDQFIPKGTIVSAPKTAAALRETLSGLDDTPAIAKLVDADRWARIATELESGKLTWKAARALRSDIGASIGKMTGPLSDASQGRLKLVYGRLSDDLADVAKASGPEAAAAWSRANKFWSARQGRIGDSLDKILKVDTPEKAFAAVEALAAKDSARGSIRKLSALKRSLPKEDWDDFAATFFSKIGEAPAGQQGAAGGGFSANTFMTKWNKMSPAARNLLSPDKATMKELNTLARSVEKLKMAGAERNFSNTAKSIVTMAFGGALVASPATAIAAAGGFMLTGRMLTSRPFVRALNRGIAGDITALKHLAKNSKDPAIKAAAASMVQNLGNDVTPKKKKAPPADVKPPVDPDLNATISNSFGQ